MKYHGHLLTKVIDADVDGGSYWFIQRIEHRVTPHKEHYDVHVNITHAWTLSNAKEFIDTFDGHSYRWEVLC